MKRCGPIEWKNKANSPKSSSIFISCVCACVRFQSYTSTDHPRCLDGMMMITTFVRRDHNRMKSTKACNAGGDSQGPESGTTLGLSQQCVRVPVCVCVCVCV